MPLSHASVLCTCCSVYPVSSGNDTHHPKLMTRVRWCTVSVFVLRKPALASVLVLVAKACICASVPGDFKRMHSRQVQNVPKYAMKLQMHHDLTKPLPFTGASIKAKTAQTHSVETLLRILPLFHTTPALVHVDQHIQQATQTTHLSKQR